MKIIKKYFLLSYFKPFTAGLFAFVLIMTITHFFDFLHVFLEYKPKAIILIKYFLYKIPEWTVLISPIATLMGILFSIGALNRDREITAVKSSGIKLRTVFFPIII